ncbi:MAG: hypothetical protein JWP01_921 [Myxococcales bacterium]|nr:hypothetical protein [Myxococcales bacterium]
MAVRALCIALVVAGLAAPVHAQPSGTPSEVLRLGNAAATAGDWQTVSALTETLLKAQLPSSDLAEAHRLAGLAAFFQKNIGTAELHFLSYLRIDLDGQLDPNLYPPEAILFFNDVKAKHNAELRARRKRGNRYRVLTLVPMFAQWQNGERTKGIVVGTMFTTFLVANATSFGLLRSWCNEQDRTCDAPTNRTQLAGQLRAINLVTGVGLIATYAYSVYDGVKGYRRITREERIVPFVTASSSDSFIGVAGTF